MGNNEVGMWCLCWAVRTEGITYVLIIIPSPLELSALKNMKDPVQASFRSGTANCFQTAWPLTPPARSIKVSPLPPALLCRRYAVLCRAFQACLLLCCFILPAWPQPLRFQNASEMFRLPFVKVNTLRFKFQILPHTHAPRPVWFCPPLSNPPSPRRRLTDLSLWLFTVRGQPAGDKV